MIALIAVALGIISTILAWRFNPRRALYAELDNIYKDLEVQYAHRDKALADHNSDVLTMATTNIIRLSNRKAVILQRF